MGEPSSSAPSAPGWHLLRGMLGTDCVCLCVRACACGGCVHGLTRSPVCPAMSPGSARQPRQQHPPVPLPLPLAGPQVPEVFSYKSDQVKALCIPELPSEFASSRCAEEWDPSAIATRPVRFTVPKPLP